MKVGSLKVVLKLAVGKFKSGIMVAKNALKKFGQGMKKLGITFKSSFGAMIRHLKRFAIVGTGIFIGMTVAAARFEEEIHRTAIIIGKGTEVAKNQYKALIDKARELGRETLFSSTQAAKGMQLMAKAGFNTGEIIASIADVVNLAVAGNLELESATQVVASALRQFQLNAADAGRVADVLTVTANSAMITVEGLGEAMKYAAPVAKALGNDLEDTAAIMGAVANLGLDASQVGTALRRMMVRLLAPTKQVDVALTKLGLETVDKTTGKMRRMIDILSDLQRSFQSGTMTQVEFQRALAGIAGTRGVTALMGIVGQANLDLNVMADNLRDVEGAAKRMADEFRKTTIGRFKDLIASVNELSITAIGAFENSIKDMLFGIRNWVLALQQAFEENNKLKNIVDGLKEGFTPLVDKIKEFATAITGIAENMDGLEVKEAILTKFDRLGTALESIADVLMRIKFWVDKVVAKFSGISTALKGIASLIGKLSGYTAEVEHKTWMRKLVKGLPKGRQPDREGAELRGERAAQLETAAAQEEWGGAEAREKALQARIDEAQRKNSELRESAIRSGIDVTRMIEIKSNEEIKKAFIDNAKADALLKQDLTDMVLQNNKDIEAQRKRLQNLSKKGSR